MSISSLADWGKLELKAQTAELAQVDSPKVPTPTIEQQLVFALKDIVKCKSSLHRKDAAISEAIMWLSVGDTQRAMEVLNRGLLDL